MCVSVLGVRAGADATPTLATVTEAIPKAPAPGIDMPAKFTQILMYDYAVPPASTVEDLVSYTDHLVRIHIERESELPMSAAEIADGYGMVIRQVTYSVVDDVWSADGAPALPRQGTLGGNGWIQDGDQRTAFKQDADPWFVVGHDYLVAFQLWNPAEAGLDVSDSNPRWRVVSPEATAAYDGGVVGQGEPLHTSAQRPYLRARLAGLTRTQLRNFFATTPKHSRSATFHDVNQAPLTWRD